MRITVRGKRSEISVGRDCDPEKWNSRAGRCTGTKESIRVLNDYLDTLAHQVRIAHQQLIDTIDLPYRNPIEITADRYKIGSVVSNMFCNAIKYSPNKKPVNIIVDQDEVSITVSIKDEGMGIKPHDLEKLFDRFYRVENLATKIFPVLESGYI